MKQGRVVRIVYMHVSTLDATRGERPRESSHLCMLCFLKLPGKEMWRLETSLMPVLETRSEGKMPVTRVEGRRRISVHREGSTT